MKKILFAVLTLTCALTISCGDEPPERLQNEFPYTGSDDLPLNFGSSQVYDLKFSDGYIYKVYEGMLYRLNPRTGNVTEVCGDPLCNHSTPDCPLYSLSSIYHFTESGEICYYTENVKMTTDAGGNPSLESTRQFVRYDAENHKKIIIDDFADKSASFGPEIYSGKWRIYVGQEYDAENDKLIFGLRRADLDSGKNAFWGGEKLADGTYKPLDNVDPLFALDGRFWFNDGKFIFSLDENGKDRINHLEPNLPIAASRIQTDGEWLYHLSPDRNSILRARISDGTTETVVGEEDYSGFPFILTQNYIYYQSGSDITVGKAEIPGYAADEIVLNGEKILRCRHDGSEKELVCVFEGTLRPTQWIVVGNYLYCSFTRWDDADGDGVFHREDMYFSDDIGCELLRVDLSTGEKLELTIVKQEAK